MRDSVCLQQLLVTILCWLSCQSVLYAEDAVEIFPAKIQLNGKADQQRLAVTLKQNGKLQDATSRAIFGVDRPEIVAISKDGVIRPLQSGTATIFASVNGQKVTAEVAVRSGSEYLPVTFEKDILPILSRTGCNAGACHGKSGGQNGFQLSLLGFDPNFDHSAITKEARGRRLFPAAPEQSLFLLKATGQMAHGGGRRIDKDSDYYQLLLRWITNGTPRTPDTTPLVERISVFPPERSLLPKGQQQLIVTAHYSDGSTSDVTHLATFQSNESVIAAVDASGMVQAGPLPGEAAIMTRFMEKFAVSNILIPLPNPAPTQAYAKFSAKNFIDDLALQKWKQLGIAPSAGIDDHKFLRRVYLDVIGRVPMASEIDEFLAIPSSERREKIVDQLLARPEYADHWANKWADLVRPNPYRVGIKAVFSLDGWLRESFRQNKPYDQFVREILTAEGSTFRNGAVTIFRDRREPDEITTMVSQLFLGIRLDCAKCHHHPFEVWSQDDFYSFAAYFARIGRKGRGLSPPISGSEEVIYCKDSGEVKHPLTGKVLSPRPLFGKANNVQTEDNPRKILADWIVNDNNPYFAKVMANRVWADIMGRGFVEPVDDLRASNPPSNEPLLDALANQFRKDRYDIKKLIRTILLSEVYALSSIANEYNVGDLRNYSRHYRQRLRAEVLLDAVSDITGVEERFSAMPTGSRAMQLWTVRSQSIFLDSFGRPDPNQDPPCERTSDTTVVQALHLMNSPGLHGKVTSDNAIAAKLAKSKQSPTEIVRALYLRTYCRPPSAEELDVCLNVFAQPDVSRRQATEDILWSLINTPEFLFKD